MGEGPELRRLKEEWEPVRKLTDKTHGKDWTWSRKRVPLKNSKDQGEKDRYLKGGLSRARLDGSLDPKKKRGGVKAEARQLQLQSLPSTNKDTEAWEGP